MRAGELHFLGRTLPSEGSRFKTREGTKRGSGKVERGRNQQLGKTSRRKERLKVIDRCYRVLNAGRPSSPRLAALLAGVLRGPALSKEHCVAAGHKMNCDSATMT